MGHKKLEGAIKDLSEFADLQQAFNRRVHAALEALERADKLDARISTLELMGKLQRFGLPEMTESEKLKLQKDLGQAEHPAIAQVRRLVDYILDELPGRAEMAGEDAADTAIRLLKRYREALGRIAKTNYRLGTQFYPAATMSEIAQDALGIQEDDNG